MKDRSAEKIGAAEIERRRHYTPSPMVRHHLHRGADYLDQGQFGGNRASAAASSSRSSCSSFTKRWNSAIVSIASLKLRSRSVSIFNRSDMKQRSLISILERTSSTTSSMGIVTKSFLYGSSGHGSAAFAHLQRLAAPPWIRRLGD